MSKRFRVNRPVMAKANTIYRTGYEGEMPELADNDVEEFLALGAISYLEGEDQDDDVASAELSEEQKKVLSDAVKQLMAEEPDRNRPPKVADVKAIIKFDVSADEIKVVYDTLKAEAETGNSGDNQAQPQTQAGQQ